MSIERELKPGDRLWHISGIRFTLIQRGERPYTWEASEFDFTANRVRRVVLTDEFIFDVLRLEDE